jgi:hypothetical protein
MSPWRFNVPEIFRRGPPFVLRRSAGLVDRLARGFGKLVVFEVGADLPFFPPRPGRNLLLKLSVGFEGQAHRLPGALNEARSHPS